MAYPFPRIAKKRSPDLAGCRTAVEVLEARRLLSAVLTHDFNTATFHLNTNGEQFYPASNGRLFFVDTQIGGGQSLYTSDGTNAGTFRLNTPTELTGQYLISGNKLYFGARTTAHPVSNATPSQTLWVSDGTQGGTHQVTTVTYDASGNVHGLNDATNLIAGPNGTVYFDAHDGNVLSPKNIWSSDGSAAGTHLVSGNAIILDSKWVTVGNTTYFRGSSAGISGAYKTNGTAAGTTLVGPANVLPAHFAALGSTVFFRNDANDHLYKVGGSAVGGTLYGFADNETAVGNKLFFTASNGTETQLYYLTATGGPSLVKSHLNAVSMVSLNNTLYFLGSAFPTNGLFKTDGTAAGTKAINSTNIATYQTGLIVVQDRLFGKGFTGQSNNELWVSDGTSGGTKRAAVLPAPPQTLAGAGSAGYFQLQGSDGLQVWTVRNPTSANAGGPYTVTEGGTVALAGAGTDADPKATLTYKWDFDGDGIFGETGAAAKNGNETGKNAVFNAAGLGAVTSTTVKLEVVSGLGLTSNVVSATVRIRPKAATALTFTVAQHHVTLHWADNSAIESGFKIERSTDNINFTVLKTLAAKVTTYLDASTTAGKKYYYRVVATNALADGQPSNTVTMIV